MPFEPGETPEGAKPFEPGKSGNPKGRPKGARSLSTILKEMLEEPIEVIHADGTKERREFREVIIRKLLQKANNGDMRAIQEIFDRIEGKANQTLKHEGEGFTININPK
jgi:hypothetical protein